MNETKNNETPLSKADELYNRLMGWEGITYIVIAAYLILAANNIYQTIKRSK